MSVQKLNDWLGVAANIGIIVGLVFVGMEYRNNSALVEIEANSNVENQVNEIIDVVIADPSLIEIMGKEESELSNLESDRLRLLGVRMLMAMSRNYRDIAERETRSLDELASVQRAIYHRPRLNYGLPYAWRTFKARADSPFVQWFETNVIAIPPNG